MAHELPAQLLSTCTDGILYCFSLWASRVTLGAFWIFMLLGFQFSLFIGASRFGNARSFGFASFVGLLGGFWLAILQLITWWVASIFILVGTIGIGIMILNEK